MNRRPRKPVTAARLERIALYYLERFSASAAGVRAVLHRRIRRADEDLDEPQALAWVEDIIARLEKQGLVDDARFAVGRVGTLHRQGRPRQRIAMGLAQKGIDQETIARTMASFIDENPAADLQAALIYARKRRLGPFGPPGEPEKQLAAMVRRGFDLNTARRILACPDRASAEALLDEAA